MMGLFFWGALWSLVPGLLLRVDAGGAGILPLDILAAVFLVLWATKIICIDREIPSWKPLFAGFSFAVLAIVSWSLGAWDLLLKEQILSLSYIIRFLGILAFGAYAYTHAENTAWRGWFWRNVWWVCALILGLGLAQFYLFPDLANISTEGGWDPHQGRLLGSWMDPNFMAGFLGLMLPTFIARGWGRGVRERKLWWALAGGAFVCLFLTFSRSGYLAAAMGLTLFFGLRRPSVLLLAGLVVVLGVSVNTRAQKRLLEFSGTVKSIVLRDTDEIDPTANLRLQSWGRSMELWRTSPVLGIGYNTYRTKAAEAGIVQENYFSAGGADSTHITILVTTGVIGFVAFIWFYWVLFWGHMQRWIRQKSTQNLALASGAVALFVHAIFVNSLLFPFLFFALMATSAVLSGQDEHA